MVILKMFSTDNKCWITKQFFGDKNLAEIRWWFKNGVIVRRDVNVLIKAWCLVILISRFRFESAVSIWAKNSFVRSSFAWIFIWKETSLSLSSQKSIARTSTKTVNNFKTISWKYALILLFLFYWWPVLEMRGGRISLFTNGFLTIT